MALFTPRPRALRGRPRKSLIDVTLDPAQLAAVKRPPGGAMLVLGEAGHGKTTVALHRLAQLYHSAPFDFRAVVIVPHVELEHMLQPLMVELGLDVRVKTYGRFARAQARRAFGDIPRRESREVAASVLHMKRSRELMPLLVELAAAPPRPIDDDFDAPPPRTRAHAHRADLQHLFGDGDRMRRLAQALGLGARAVETMLEHTHVQFLERSERAYSYVDADRLTTLDAYSLDAGTPVENAESIDPEDYAVLFELDRQRAQRLGLPPSRPRRHHCIAIDEAQELAPLELRLVGRSLARGGSLIVAGDADQQTDSTASFDGWPASMRRLRAQAYATVKLEIGYRCPPAVVALARVLRSGAGDGEPCAPPEPRTQFPLVHCASVAALHALLAREARAIERRDPFSGFCVIAREREQARAIAAALRGRVACKLVLDGEFALHRGIDVTTVDRVKGLEFDYVIVPDLSRESYPDTAESRRALYVAVTRTRHELLLACVGEPSPWLLGGGQSLFAVTRATKGSVFPRQPAQVIG